MRLSKPALLLFLVFIFTVVQGQAVTNERVVCSKSSTTVRRSGGCEKQGFEYKEGNGGLEDTVLENEDYIYTNFLP
ncbi:hypothetical protein AAZX31_06G138800 [Glycine max]|uniref:Phytosulfokine-beta n=2 Tax=Glycine subgen. Soja TaxID=1462606 RepID=A0A0R0JKY7_SOYBN|nr:hypothetical protein JHK87_015212 [Glycine soja]KAG5031691.1 hypothetical protein JHK85_015673 [Glycine max]KAG5045909.1 hypothetical protein JHK86_015315 [Glycine max]KAG5148408.1 hypothetical protein JHK82_015289 [Glycine max]KAH1125918.1 hypothetical protein GYH30_015107 [Glycine max]